MILTRDRRQNPQAYCVTQQSYNQIFDRIYRINKIFKHSRPVKKFSRMMQICRINSIVHNA